MQVERIVRIRRGQRPTVQQLPERYKPNSFFYIKVMAGRKFDHIYQEIQNDPSVLKKELPENMAKIFLRKALKNILNGTHANTAVEKLTADDWINILGDITSNINGQSLIEKEANSFTEKKAAREAFNKSAHHLEYVETYMAFNPQALLGSK